MAMRCRPFLTLLAAGLCLATCLGCGPKRPPTAVVSGHVTYAGKPLAVGRIMFWPQHGRPAMGEIGPDGGYRLTTFAHGDGALLGSCRVTIEAKQDAPPPKGPNPDGLPPINVIKWLIPQSYSRQETSPLTAEVKAGENTINFDLPGERP